jgi:Bacteriophage Lambda NinG protein
MSKAEQAHKPRTGTCKVCKTKYTKAKPLQSVCGIECAKTIAAKKNQIERSRKDRQDTKARKEAIEGLPELKRKAQTAFNGFIRARDAEKPCISCGASLIKEAFGGGFDCGHYRSVGSAPHLRYNEDNAHGQCKRCNRYGSGMVVQYRHGLIDRIGLERIRILEADQCIRKYTKDGLRELAAQYRDLTRQIKRSGT